MVEGEERSRVMNKQRVTAVFTLLVLTSSAVLAGCASRPEVPEGNYPDVTLARSKSPVQLVRNSVGTRIPAIVLESVDETEDTSIACLSIEEDPEGYIRSWRSSVEATIVSGSAWRVDAIASNLIQSFTDQGWTSVDDGDSTRVSNGDGVELIVTPLPVSETEAQIRIEANGPCVVTAGSDSDEVRSLEGS